MEMLIPLCQKATMLSIVRSRMTLVVQFVFLAVNAVGVLLAVLYNSDTQDLYPNNAHHNIGWIVTSLMCSQVLIHLVGRLAGAMAGRGHRGSDEARICGSVSHVDYWQRVPTHYPTAEDCRLSNDSGQGTEPVTEPSRNNSVSTSDENIPLNDQEKEVDDGEPEVPFLDTMELPYLSTHTLATKATRVVSSRIWACLDLTYRVTDRIILPFGFIALTTGVITFGRFFVSPPLTVIPNDNLGQITRI
jgi:hypothetical protein